jgi:hypothetical protein
MGRDLWGLLIPSKGPFFFFRASFFSVLTLVPFHSSRFGKLRSRQGYSTGSRFLWLKPLFHLPITIVSAVPYAAVCSR